MKPLPELRGCKVLALDTEAYCPRLLTHGPQVLTGGVDHPIGFSYASDTGEADYIPIAHTTGGNYEGPWLEWLKFQCARKDLTIVMANASFDREMIWQLGIDITAQVEDVIVLDALCNENEISYSLDAIAKRRGFGSKIELDADKSDLRGVPPEVLGPYAIKDAELTRDIYLNQCLDIEAQDLGTVAGLECELGPILWRMRRLGVRVDVAKAEATNERLGGLLQGQLEALRAASPVPFDPWSSQSLSALVRAFGLVPPTTARGADSVTSDWLKVQGVPLLTDLAKYRKGEKIRRDFIQGTLLEQQYNGRIHPSWLSTRGGGFLGGNDVNGTRSGRLACVNPNLQQGPSRHPEYGSLYRSHFLPEEGDQWLSCDYQAQEIRVGLHYANKTELDGAAEMVREYQNNPALDYHQATMERINKLGGMQISRNSAKVANLSIQYGIGVTKLAGTLGMSIKDTKEFLAAYHRGVPFVKQALGLSDKVAQSRGYVKTILGRRRRFDSWENGAFGSPWAIPVRDKDEAARLYNGKIKRAGTFKAFNSIVQGTSAEMTKAAMCTLSTLGITPMMTIHDELCFSIPEIGPNRIDEIKREMENALVLTVPIRVTTKIGSNWGDAK